jgi:hypothetical protein
MTRIIPDVVSTRTRMTRMKRNGIHALKSPRGMIHLQLWIEDFAVPPSLKNHEYCATRVPRRTCLALLCVRANY